MMPRLLRQSPLNGVWEGSGNVICLDVLRALAKEPKVIEAYWAEVAHAKTGNSVLDRAIEDLHVDLSEPEAIEARARSVVEQMALVFQASLLVRFAAGRVADAFCSSRLSGAGPGVFGKLPSGVDSAFILERHAPENHLPLS
jgi:putative acyl-CoA dehydrogenase